MIFLKSSAITAALAFVAALAASANTVLSAGEAPAPVALVDLATILPADYSLNGKWDISVLDESYDLDAVSSEPASSLQPTTISVPSNWYLAGIDHAGAALYKKTFSVSRERSGQRVTLEFAGVDYQATVWVNGALAGKHTGYFADFAFDVTNQLKFGEPNVISVLVNSPREDAASWSQWKRLIKGVLSHHDTRPGGAWAENGQDRNTGGIWAGVKLHFSGPVRIGSVKIEPHVAQSGLTNARLNLGLDADKPVGGQIQIKTKLRPANFSGASIERTFAVDCPHDGQVELNLPEHAGALWWPKQLGRPNLYALDVEIWKAGKLTDKRSERFAYRTVEFDAPTGSWRINGRRLFLKGTNYIPTQWLSEMSKAAYVRDLQLMQDAYINAVRVHAMIVSEPFYDAADEAGILVWQDFPLQWGYSDEPKFQVEAIRQAGEMVRTLFNHPSIVAWSMQNEPPWDAWWMKYKYPNYDPEQNRGLTSALAETVRSLDTTRHTHAFSATGEHTWQGWYSGHWRDFEKPTKQVLVTEFGAQALPDLPTLQKIFGVGSLLWPDTPGKMEIWRYHNFQPDETFTNAGVRMGKNISEFVANSQSYQSNLIRVAAESYRRQKYAPVGGIFQFMFVEDWPSVNWGIVDYLRHPKPGYKMLKQAYQPVLPSVAGLETDIAAGDEHLFPVWVVNDLNEKLNDCELEILLVQNSKIIAQSRFNFAIGADAAEKIVDWAPPHLSVGAITLTVSVKRAATVLGSSQLEINVHD